MLQTAAADPFWGLDDPAPAPTPHGPITSRLECLTQLLGAFRDIADLDDIHQAAERLGLIQAWLQDEARRAAADPIFDD